MNYVDEILKEYQSKYQNEPEFMQAVTEVLSSLNDIIFENEEEFRKEALLERFLTPDRIITFRVPWIDDKGNMNINMGYRIQWSNVNGPYKGGLRFHPSVNQSILKFLAFEQTFKNALTSLPMGGAKGGSDFDPKGKSDREIMNFCQSFMTELHKYIGPNMDVPAGDIGVGAREIGYMFGQYRRLTSLNEGVLTGKGLTYGGSLVRKEATGYGLLYITEAMLKYHNLDIKGKKILISGAGNVAIYAMEKAYELGATPITCSDSDGFIYDENGIDLKLVKEIKEVKRARIKTYLEYHKNAKYYDDRSVWNIKGDIALPCATQNELDLDDAIALVKNGIIAVCEGANMPTTSEATEYLLKNKILFLPGKAANAGGVATSGLEMAQNSMRIAWTFEEVDNKLNTIMNNIFVNITETCVKYKLGQNYLAGANLTAFLKLVNSMLAMGV